MLKDTGSKIGRLSNKYDSMTTRIATTESVRSTIEDADFAEEQMELIKAQICNKQLLQHFLKLILHHKLFYNCFSLNKK